ncbi:MAG: DUF3540 domain-containing protein [Polyangiaceae bacterium]
MLEHEHRPVDLASIEVSEPKASGAADRRDAAPSDGDTSPTRARFVAASGASARLRGVGSSEWIEVRDKHDRLVFELDAATGRTIVHVATRDLEIRAPGDVSIVAGGTFAVRAPTTRVESRDVRATLHDVKVVASRIETVADRVFEQARSAFRTILDLHQLRAGRARTVVDAAWELRAGHADVEAKEEVKIDGRAIHLG